MKEKRITKGTLRLLVALAAAVGVLAVALILRTSETACEFICRYLVNAYQAVVGRIISVVPFNVFELLAALAAAGAIACVAISIALLCKKKRIASRRVMLSLVLAAVCIVDIYVFSAGFAYNRKPAPIDSYQGEINIDITREAYYALVDEFNSLYESLEKEEDGRAKCPYTEKQLREAVRVAVDDALSDRYYYSYTPKLKPVTCSEIMAQNRIAGITFLPTVEPGYNRFMPVSEQCFTMAHEYAHSKGVMRENEADVAATYALINSGDVYLKYCAYVDVLGGLNHFIKPDEHGDIDVNDGYSAELRYSFKYWIEKDLFASIGEFFNDLYLKINGEKEGTGSYDDLPSGEQVDTGETDEEGNPVFETVIREYTKMDRMMLGYYLNTLGRGYSE